MNTNPLLRWEKHFEEAFSEFHNLDDLLTGSIKSTKELNFEFFAYEIFKSTPFMRPEFYIYSNYPAKWISQYRKMNHALADPRIHHSKVLDEILCWNSDLFKETPDLMSDAMESGLCIGLTQPTIKCIGAVEFFSLARRETDISSEELKDLKPKVEAFANILQTKLYEINNKIHTCESITLSVREKEILRWTADGKTSEETAIILNLTIDTINFHQKKIQNKIGAGNRVQAVAYAIAKGHI